ncbi:MAG: hypothetical protein AAFX79_10580 [Planctomycetota bacterium]
MAGNEQGFEDLRQILHKLDRSLDEAQRKRTHGPGDEPEPRTAPEPTPALTEDAQSGASNGRLKARPLRRARPENSGWVR